MDGHTALDSTVVGEAQTEGVEVVLVRLVHGKDRADHTIHIAPSNTPNLSGKLIAVDVLVHMKLPPARCKFTTRGVCAWRKVSESTDVDVYSRTLSKAVKQLGDADSSLVQSLFLELPKAESKSRLNDRYLGSLGDGHRGEEVKRFDNSAEDDRFRYRMTYLKRAEYDAGWVTHLVAKGELDPEASAALRMLGFRRLDECPEADFEACLWHSVTNPYAGQFVADAFEEDRPADLAHRSFQALPQVLPQLLDQIVDAHRTLETLGLRYLPTPEPVRGSPTPRQQFVAAGSPYDAYAAIRNLVGHAAISW